jgi:hypothetical protein
VTAYKEGGTWQDGNDRITGHSGNGAIWPLLGSLLMADAAVPIAFITTTLSGTDVAGARNTWASGGTQYALMVSTVSASGVNAVKAVLSVVGSNAAIFGDAVGATITQAAYNAGIDSMANGFAADLPGAPKTFVPVIGETLWASAPPPDIRTALDHVRAAVLEAVGDNSNVLLGPVLIDQNYADDLHYASDAELLQVARRYYVRIADELYSKSFGRGPRIVSSSLDVAKTVVTVTVDRDLATGTSYTGFRVTDSGTPASISGVSRTGTRTFTITVSSALSSAANTRVYCASGNDAVGATVPTSVSVTLPDTNTITLPIEPFYDQIPKANYAVTAASGSFVETGTAATLKYARRLVAGAGAFAETGTAANLKAGWRVTAGSGSFSLTGTPATLRYSGGLTSYTLAAAGGGFVWTGTAATLKATRRLAVDSGSFVLTGTAATLTGPVTVAAAYLSDAQYLRAEADPIYVESDVDSIFFTAD